MNQEIGKEIRKLRLELKDIVRNNPEISERIPSQYKEKLLKSKRMVSLENMIEFLGYGNVKISKSTLSSIEQGRISIKLNRLEKIFNCAGYKIEISIRKY